MPNAGSDLQAQIARFEAQRAQNPRSRIFAPLADL